MKNIIEDKKRLLVLGSGGLLGSGFVKGEYLLGWEVLAHGRFAGANCSADLSKANEVVAMLDDWQPDVLLNLVGLTNVDHCESFPNDAYIGNVKTLENVVSWIKKQEKSVHLVHISTDQVYDGLGPHSEEHVSLTNCYAFSKYTGELIANSVDTTILRTNFFGKSICINRNSLTDWLYSELSSEENIQVFEDVLFSPLSMATLYEMIEFCILNKVTGIYNLGSREGLSKADFAYQFAKITGLNSKFMKYTSVADVDFLKTYRPKDMRLNVDRFESATGITLPNLTDEIRRAAKDYSI